jgi:hypothetical protein
VRTQTVSAGKKDLRADVTEAEMPVVPALATIAVRTTVSQSVTP